MTDVARLLRVLAAMLFAAALMRPGIGHAGRPTMNECFEASDFIRNAALARDAGVHSEVFLGQMEEDFAAMGGFPADLLPEVVRFRQPLRQGHILFQDAKGRPQRLLQHIRLPRLQAFGGELVAYVTLVP